MEGAQHDTCRIIMQRKVAEAKRQLTNQSRTIHSLQSTVDLLTDKMKQQLNTALAMQEETLRQKDLTVNECASLRQQLIKLEGADHTHHRRNERDDLQRERDLLMSERDQLRLEVTELRRRGPELPFDWSFQQLDLTLHRTADEVGLGLCVWGGRDVCCTPGDTSIYVTKVMTGSVAERYGLRVNDVLLAMNGNDLLDVEHCRAVQVLKQCATTSPCRLVVRRKREVYCTACKQSKAPLTNDAANDAANDVANDVGSDVANDVANNLDVLGTLQKDRDLRQKKLWYTSDNTMNLTSDSNKREERLSVELNENTASLTDNISHDSEDEINIKSVHQSILHSVQRDVPHSVQRDVPHSVPCAVPHVVPRSVSQSELRSVQSSPRTIHQIPPHSTTPPAIPLRSNSVSVANLSLHFTSPPKRSQSVDLNPRLHKAPSLQTVEVDNHFTPETITIFEEDSNLRDYCESNNDLHTTSPTVSRDECCFPAVISSPEDNPTLDQYNEPPLSPALHRKKYEPKSIARWPSDKRFSQIKSDLFSCSMQSDLTMTFPSSNIDSTTFPVASPEPAISPGLSEPLISPTSIASPFQTPGPPKRARSPVPPSHLALCPTSPERHTPELLSFINLSSVTLKESNDSGSRGNLYTSSSSRPIEEQVVRGNQQDFKTPSPIKPSRISSPKPRPPKPPPIFEAPPPPPLKSPTTFHTRIPAKISPILDQAKADVMEEWERRTEMKRKIEQAEEASKSVPTKDNPPPNNTPTRLLVYTKPTPSTSLGLSIVSSDNDRAGIFIAQLAANCPDTIAKVVKLGDQILEVNETDVRTATHAEFVKELVAHQDLTLLLQQNIARFGGVFQMVRGSTFYIRALYDQEKTKEEGLKFFSGNILHVLDKRKEANDGWWLACLVGRSGQDIKCGLIPSRQRAEKMLVEEEKKPQRSRRNRRSTRTARQHDPAPQNEPAVTVAPYERVIEHSVQYTRPVVILGPLSELVIARLAKEHPNTFQVCQLHKSLEPSGPLVKGDDPFYTGIDSIKDIARQKKHCLLDVGITAIERLHHAELYPIVIFLKFGSSETIVKQQGVSCKLDQAQAMLSNSDRLEQEHSVAFTAVIEGEELSAMYDLSRKAIRHNSGPIVWLPQTSRGFL